MRRKINKCRSINYKRNHKNSKNQGITAEFAEFLDRRIDKEFDQERKRLQNLIAQYTRIGVRPDHMSFTRQVIVSLEIPDPVSKKDWENSVRDVVYGIGEKVVEEIMQEKYGPARYVNLK